MSLTSSPATTGASVTAWNASNRGIGALLWAAAVLVLLYGVFIVWRYSWLDIYADQWYIYGILLGEAFPDNVLRAVNGHRIVFPNLIRLIELYWLDGDQSLQRACGLGFAAGTVLAFWWLIAHERTIQPIIRGCSALVVAVGIFWLANGRMLLHAAESTQIYLVIFMMSLACVALAPVANADRTVRPMRVWLASVCGLVAALSFGYGMVLFPAALVALVVLRVPLRTCLPLVYGLIASLALYLATPGPDGVREVVHISLLDNISVGLRWLGAPVTQAIRPFIDPGHALSYLGDWWDEPMVRGAREFAAAHGSTDQLFWLPLCAGAAGVGLAFWYSWRIWRTRAANRIALVGLMSVWFGLGAAGVIALTRAAYFSAHPLQIAADRYLPMPILFWAGTLVLGLVHIARTARNTPWGYARLVLACALCAHVCATHPTWRVWAELSQSFVRTQNLMLIADVMPPADLLGETPEHHMRESLPLLRARGVALFGHPALTSLDRTLPNTADASLGEGLTTLTPAQRFDGTPAAVVDIDMTAFTRSVRAPLWLLLNAQDEVIGLAAPYPLRSTRRLRGVVRSTGELMPHRAVPWAPDMDGAQAALVLREAATSR